MTTLTWGLQHRRDSIANWASNNPALLAGQIGIETDDLTTRPKYKIGDGATAWSALPYANDFIYRSGTETSKPVTGSIEWSNNTTYLDPTIYTKNTNGLMFGYFDNGNLSSSTNVSYLSLNDTYAALLKGSNGIVISDTTIASQGNWITSFNIDQSVQDVIYMSGTNGVKKLRADSTDWSMQARDASGAWAYMGVNSLTTVGSFYPSFELSAFNEDNSKLIDFYSNVNDGYIELDTHTGGKGIQYTANAATGVVANQGQYTILHRAAGDSRWAQLSGATFTGNVNGVTPTELTYLSGATSNLQNQINNINSGLSWKAAARVLTTSNVNLSSPGSSIDGVSMSSGDRVVLAGQTTAAQNGVYVWHSSSSALTRSTDCSTGGTGSTGILGMTIAIEEGTNADQMWMCSTNGPITIGTTALTFIKSSATTYTGSNGITLSGNNFTLDNSYFSGDATISGGVISIGNLKITNSMLAGSIAASKLIGTDISTVGTLTAGSTGTGFTLNFGSSTLSGTIPTTNTAAKIKGALAVTNGIAYQNGATTDTVTNSSNFTIDTTNNSLILGTITSDFSNSTNKSSLYLTDNSASNNVRVTLQNKATNGQEGILIGESLTSANYSYFIRFNQTYAGFWPGTSVTFASLTSFNAGGGGAEGNGKFAINGNPVYILVGQTTTNYGFRADATGLRIDQIQNLHTANTSAFSVGSNFAFNPGNSFTALLVKGSSGGGAYIGSLDANWGGFWASNVTPTATNYAFIANGTSVALNIGSTSGNILQFNVTDTVKANMNSSGNFYFGGSTSASEVLQTNGNLFFDTIGKGLIFKEGANGRIGESTLTSGTVTVSNTSITANTRIFLSRKTNGSANGYLSYSVVIGTSFTINSDNSSDNGTIEWILIEKA